MSVIASGTGGGGGATGAAGGDLAGTYPNPTVVDANIDHGSIGGLADDDHTQYLVKAPTSTRNKTTAQDATTIPLSLVGASGQTAALLEMLTSADVLLARLRQEGNNAIFEIYSGASLVQRMKDSGYACTLDGFFAFSASSSNLNSLDASFVRHAAGVTRASDGTSYPGGLGGFLAARPVAARTADLALSATESGRTYTNDGASGTVVLTLPAATISAGYGWQFFFAVEAGQILRIKANGTDVIRFGSTVTSAGGQVESATIGHAVLVTCTKAGESVCIGSGTWSAT